MVKVVVIPTPAVCVPSYVWSSCCFYWCYAADSDNSQSPMRAIVFFTADKCCIYLAVELSSCIIVVFATLWCFLAIWFAKETCTYTTTTTISTVSADIVVSRSTPIITITTTNNCQNKLQITFFSLLHCCLPHKYCGTFIADFWEIVIRRLVFT